MKSNTTKNDSICFYLVMSITLSRLVFCIPVILIHNSIFSTCLTIWIGVSDFLDGYLARKWKVSTLTGEKLDQYIDKIVTTILLLYYLAENQISALFVTLIIFREVAILILRSLMLLSSSSNILGKLKTFLLYILFVIISCNQSIPIFFLYIKPMFEYLIIVISYTSLLISLKRCVIQK